MQDHNSVFICLKLMLINFGHIPSASIYGSSSVCLLVLPLVVRTSPARVFIWVHILENAWKCQCDLCIQFFISGTSCNILYLGDLNFAGRGGYGLYLVPHFEVCSTCAIVSTHFLRINGIFPI